MTSNIVTEVLDDKTQTWRPLESFDTFEVFYAHAVAFKESDSETVRRVFILGSFDLNDEELEKINGLGIQRV